MILVPVLSFNIKSGVLRFYYKKNDAYWQSLLVISVISLIISLVISLFINKFFSLFFFIIFFNIILSIFRGKEQLFFFNLFRIIPPIILFLFISIYGPDNHEQIIFYTGLAYLSSCVIFYSANMNRIHNKLKNPILIDKIVIEIKDLLRYSLPTVITAVSLWFYSFFDQYIIEHYYNFKYLSSYSVAVRIINLFKVLLSVVLVIYPVFYFKNYDNPEKIKKVRFFVIIGVSILLLIFLIFREYVYIIFNATNYVDSSYLMMILIISEALRFISSLYLTIIAYLKRNIILTYIYVLLALLSICLNVIFVPKFGSLSSALISIFVSITFVAVALVINKKYEFK